MAADTLSLSDLVSRASSRAVSPTKAVKLLRDFADRHGYNNIIRDDEISSAFMQNLLKPYASTLINQYLVQSLSSQLVFARTVLIHLLFYLNNNIEISVQPQSLQNIAYILVDHFSTSPQESFPSTLTQPPTTLPGSSTSPPSISTLHLLLPLLQQCTLQLPPSPAQTTTPIQTLLSLILPLIPPYPAPPLDVGLQAGSLLQILPDSLSLPLRGCLSGLMADVTDSQNIQAGLTKPVEMPDLAGLSVDVGEGKDVDLSSPFVGLPLAQSVDLLLANIYRMERYTTSHRGEGYPPTVPQSHIDLVHFGPQLTPDPAQFLAQVIQSSFIDYLSSYTIVTKESIRKYLFIVEELPKILKWWKDNSIESYPHPTSLVPILAGVFESVNLGLSTHYTWVMEVYSTMMAQADMNDDMGGGYTQPDGWMVSSIQVGLVRNLVDLGLVDNGDALTLLPGGLPVISDGESLVNRVANASKGHLRPLSHLILHAPGAAKSFSNGLLNIIKQCPSQQPPEGLFSNLSSEPDLLACLTASISPTELLDILSKHLLETEDNPELRSDDPQGSLTRFGEGVILVEAFVSHYQLPLPDLLLESRTALSLGDLGTKRKIWLNGWIKALFGQDGIDDQILLATPPQEFYRLAPCLIQQAIWATGCGQIDQEVLHSGLSYFAQPLLGWSLGGIVSWLCDEIERKGLLSALHLDVLQNLVLESTIPNPLMYVVRPGISRILDGTMGLEEVLQSSRFDVMGVKSKLDSVEYRSNAVTQSSVDPLVILRGQMNAVRQVDVSQPTFSRSLLDALVNAIGIEGRLRVVELLVREVIQPTSGFATAGNDPLLAISVLLFTLKVENNLPLSVILIDRILPMVFEPSSRPFIDSKQSYATYGMTALCRLLKYTIVCAWEVNPGFAEELGDHLVDGLLRQMDRPVTVGLGGKRKKAVAGKGSSEIGVEERGSLEVLVRALAGDEELKDRVPRIGDLPDAL